MMKFAVPITRYRDKVREQLGVSAERMVRSFYDGLIETMCKERKLIRDQITTFDQWNDERRRIRQNLLEAIGPLPLRPSIQSKTVGRVVKKNLVMERILFLSHEDSWVSANLYLPKNTSGLFPAVILAPGHSLDGKSGLARQAVFFALNGYAALAFDLVGEGERILYFHDDEPDMACSDQHNVLGMQMALYGMNLNWFILYDSLRAVDYLCTRPDIDPNRIAMTGASGGGTATFYTAAIDERIKVLAPCVSVHSGNTLSQSDDAEQVFWEHFKNDLDYPDTASFLVAPRPMLIVATAQDIWSLEGTREVYTEAQRFYRMNDAEDRIDLKVWEGGHDGGRNEQPEVILAWFDRWLNHRHKRIPLDKIDDENVPTETECLVSSKGNIFTDGYSVPRKVFSEFAKHRNTSVPDWLAVMDEYLQEIKPFATAVPHWEQIDCYRVGESQCRRIVYEPEKGLLLPAEILIPKTIKGAVILLDEIGRLETIEWQTQMASEGYLVLRPDLRGWGEATLEDKWPDLENWARRLYNGKRWEYFSLCLMAGRHAILERVKDTLALMNLAQSQFGCTTFRLCGKRGGALVAIWTALLDKRVDHLIVENFLSSYRDVVDQELPVCQADHLFFGLLGKGIDIDEMCQKIDSKRIEIRTALNGISSPVSYGNGPK